MIVEGRPATLLHLGAHAPGLHVTVDRGPAAQLTILHHQGTAGTRGPCRLGVGSPTVPPQQVDQGAGAGAGAGAHLMATPEVGGHTGKDQCQEVSESKQHLDSLMVEGNSLKFNF